MGLIHLIFSVAYGLLVIYGVARISWEWSISLKLQKFWAECCGKWCRPLLRKRLREKRLTAGQNGSVLQKTGTTRQRMLDVDVFHFLQTKALPVDLFIRRETLREFTFILVSAVTPRHKYGLRIIFRLCYDIYVRYYHYELSATTNV